MSPPTMRDQALLGSAQPSGADSTYGMFMGGAEPSPTGYVTTINRITIGTSGEGEDFGDLTTARGWSMAVADETRGVCAGGAVYSAVIDYVTVAGSIGGTATPWGADLSNAREQAGSCCDETHGLFAGGLKTGPLVILATVDHITIQTTSSVTDWGDLQAGRYTSTGSCTTGVLNNTHGMIFSGYVGTMASNVAEKTIQYLPIATTGVSDNFGDCSVIRLDAGAVANTSRALVAAGGNARKRSIDFFAVGTTGTYTDFGDLTQDLEGVKGANNATYGMFAGGTTGTYQSAVEYVTIASEGTGQAFGDLTEAIIGSTGCSA